MAHGRHAEVPGDIDHATAFVASGKWQGERDDPTVLRAHPGPVQLDRTPHDDCTGDVAPGGRRCGTRTGSVPRVDPARTHGHRRGLFLMATSQTPRDQPRAMPPLVTRDGQQPVGGHPPLTKADHRLDKIGSTNDVRLVCAHRTGTGSLSGRPAGSAGASVGTCSGYAGASMGSTTIRREGPGTLPRTRTARAGRCAAADEVITPPDDGQGVRAVRF
jgi:hypothetical protein